MRSLIVLMLFGSLSASAQSAKVYQTTLSCAVVTVDMAAPPEQSFKNLMWKNVTVKEGEETELLRTSHAIYSIYLDQHDKKYDPKESSLFLTIKTLDGKKSIAETSAFWPRQASNGRMTGFGRLETDTDFAEPNLRTQFLCDDRLVKAE